MKKHCVARFYEHRLEKILWLQRACVGEFSVAVKVWLMSMKPQRNSFVWRRIVGKHAAAEAAVFVTREKAMEQPLLKNKYLFM